MSQEEAKCAFSERKRNILYLVYQYLDNMGFEKSAETVRLEAHLQSEYTICDNMDLDTMYLEYCSYYNMKFQKIPKILKKVESTLEASCKNVKKLKSSRPSATKTTSFNVRPEPSKGSSMDAIVGSDDPSSLKDTLKIKQITNETDNIRPNVGDGVIVFRSLCDYEHCTPEWREMAEMICRDIIKTDLKVNWSDIHGNEKAVSIIKEAVLLPLENPNLFTSASLKPWKSILLHGPPGTGKSLLAKALSTVTLGRVTFFRICPSTIMSKWRGDSEKIIRVLFEVARYYAPSIIFFDEVESLTSRRDCVSEHEASRRFKNEFLSLLDGVGEDNNDIFVLATTNLPWEIDLAFLRRFEKKVLVDLPSTCDRISMIKSFLPSSLEMSDSSVKTLAGHTSGFTGDEIRLACKEVVMKQVRDSYCSQKGPKKTSISDADLLLAFQQVGPICSKVYKKYIDWSNTHGSRI